MKSKDWFPSTRAGQNVMFNNFKAKIAGYKDIFGLSNTQTERLLTICDTFIEIYQKVEQNRAAMANLTAWQETFFKGNPKGGAVPKAPTFVTFDIAENAFIGIFDEFRDFVSFIKANPNYTESIGEDLLIVANETEQQSLDEIFPDLKLSVKNDTTVEISFKKFDFDAVEIQYRKAGTENWILADKATNSPTIHTPQLTNAGQAEKFEYRASYLQKNQRSGTWSPIYTITVG